MEEIKVRNSNPEDTAFIVSTWEKHFRKHNTGIVFFVRKETYDEWHPKVIKRILQRPTTNVLVAADKEDPSVIYGYLCYEKLSDNLAVIHYCYIKSNFRKMGIAKELLKKSEIDLEKQVEFTHDTNEMKWIWSKYPKLNYNFYLV